MAVGGAVAFDFLLDGCAGVGVEVGDALAGECLVADPNRTVRKLRDQAVFERIELIAFFCAV